MTFFCSYTVTANLVCLWRNLALEPLPVSAIRGCEYLGRQGKSSRQGKYPAGVGGDKHIGRCCLWGLLTLFHAGTYASAIRLILFPLRLFHELSSSYVNRLPKLLLILFSFSSSSLTLGQVLSTLTLSGLSLQCLEVEASHPCLTLWNYHSQVSSFKDCKLRLSFKFLVWLTDLFIFSFLLQLSVHD